MKTIFKGMLVVGIFLSSSVFASINPYISGMVGSTSYTASSGNTTTTESAGIGYGLAIGLHLNRNWGVEGNYINYGDISSTNSDHLTALGVALRGLFPISGGFGLFGKAGFYSVTDSVDSSESDSGLGISIGGEYRFSRQMSATLEYQHIFVDVGGSNLRPTMYALGLNYDF